MRLKPDELKPRGRVEIFTTRGPKPIVTPINLISHNKITGQKIYQDASIDFSKTDLIGKEVIDNIIFNQGKDRVIEALASGFIKPIARMALGDRGTLPSDRTVPKVPTSDMTGLYNEVFRSDIDVTTVDTGSTNHNVKLVKTFSALDIPVTAFSNQSDPTVNEVSLILCDLLSGAPLPRTDTAPPTTPDADEESFSIRTFKSVPFDASNEISITFRYTVFIE